MSIVSKARAYLASLDAICMWLAVSAMCMMMLFTTADVFARYVLGSPLANIYELVELVLMPMVVFMAAPATYTHGKNIRLSLFDAQLNAVPLKLPFRVNALLGALAIGALSIWSGADAWELWRDDVRRFGGLSLPLVWARIWLPLGTGILALHLLIDGFFPEVPRTSQNRGSQI